MCACNVCVREYVCVVSLSYIEKRQISILTCIHLTLFVWDRAASPAAFLHDQDEGDVS